MSIETGIASRHLLPASGVTDAAEAGKKLFVRVVVSDAWSGSVAGQLLVSCLANLLCRQAALISRVEVVSKTAPLLILLPSGGSLTPFPACLDELVAWAVRNAVAFGTRPSEVGADYTIVVGTEIEGAANAGHELCVVGVGWCAWAGCRENGPGHVSPCSPNPLGPLLAAALAAGEVFKRSRGILRGRYLEGAAFSLWSGQCSDRWADVDDGPELAGRTLRPVHVAGTGAVGNTLAYVIANANLAGAYLVLIDDDCYDETSLNRCLLAGWNDVEHPKVGAVAAHLVEAGVQAYPFVGTVKSYIIDARLGLRADVAREVNELEFAVVASCVDKGASRQDIQGLRPKLLLGGSTFNLQAKSHVYGLRPGAACLACFNPAERDGERLRAMENELRGMEKDARRQYLFERGLDADTIEDHLKSVKCGGVGEAALRDFATRLPPEFSAGFVSLGAGLLLAAALIREAVFPEERPARAEATSLSFLNGKLLDAARAADDDCQMRCTK
jgi:molybdopterin/thiamine biosynthesis adenylyltransferase